MNLKNIFIGLGCLWTCAIIVRFVHDLLRLDANNFGVFFGLIAVTGSILLGDAILLVMYLVFKWWTNR